MLGEGTDDEQTKTTDPRAYPNKSVGARMAIISAGVVMNIFLGLACFVYAYGQGMDAIPARVGAVMPGSPAYKAGMRPGDEIVSIDGRRDIKFTTLTLQVALSRHGQVLRFGVKRPGREGLIEMDIQPVREGKAERPTIGILPADSLAVAGLLPPAGMADPPAYPGLVDQAVPKEFLDTLAAAGPVDGASVPVGSHEEYMKLLAAHPSAAIKTIVERRSASSGEDGPVKERLEVTLPRVPFVDFGMRMAIEPVGAIQAGSPAEAAGFRPGDRILKFDGKDFDPMQLPVLCRENAGKPMAFEVERAGADGGRKVQTLTATPDESPPWDWTPLSQEVDVPGLGLCYPVAPRVVAVKAESPAARAGLRAGDVINSMTVKPSKSAKTPDGKPAGSDRGSTLNFDDGSSTWIQAFGHLQLQRDIDVELVVNKASQPTRIQPEADQNWPFPQRGLAFLQLRTKMPPQPVASALRLGYDDTVENVLSFYAMLRSLATGRLGMGNLGGVITISRVAFGAARTGLTYLVFFLGMLSINLAVINFLPMPPLDGGQMVFLAAEKVRGRPLPESAVVAGTYFGLFLVLGLMIFVTFQDIFRLF
jgi:regulator of sigma E protease